MKIQVLGMGCPKCEQLEQNVNAAISALGLDVEVEKITELSDIIKFGVMTTPALAVDGILKSSGKLLSFEEVKNILK